MNLSQITGKLFPWQIEQWQFFQHAKRDNRLAHALIFSGIAGVGKIHFAEHFSRSLLCSELDDQGFACLSCRSCHLVTNKTHPNLHWIDGDQSSIKVDQIRLLNEFIQQRAWVGEYQLAVIPYAHKMNVNAANALLKTLEEPPPGSILLLITEQLGRLPPTILSRCQRIHFLPPPTNLALDWLNEQGIDKGVAQLLLRLVKGAPLQALTYEREDFLTLRNQFCKELISLMQKKSKPLSVALKWQEKELMWLIDMTLSWMIDIIRLQLNQCSFEEDLINIDYKEALVTQKKITYLESNIKFMDYLQHIRKLIQLGHSLNKQLLIENIFLRYLSLRN